MKRVCQYCGKQVTAKRGRAETCNECAIKYKNLLATNYNRLKYQVSKHTPEELEAIKKKYAAGVPAGEIERMVKEFVK